MTTKKKTKKKVVKKTKAVAVVKKTTAVANPKRRMAWGGVIPKSENDNDKGMVTEFCNQVSKVYGVPSLGVNAMGGNPYINKDGRLFLLAKYRTGKQAVQSMRSEIIQASNAPTETAIVKTIITLKDGVEYEAIGEANQNNCKLSAVQKTLNMMAETRSINRAIWKVIAFDVWNGIAENLAKSDMTDAEKEIVINAGKVSSEEMAQPETQPVNTGTPDEEIVTQLKEKINDTKDVAVLMDYAEKLAGSKSSKKVKDEVGKYIQNKVKELS